MLYARNTPFLSVQIHKAYIYAHLVLPLYINFLWCEKGLIYQPFVEYLGISTLSLRVLGCQNYHYGMYGGMQT